MKKIITLPVKKIKYYFNFVNTFKFSVLLAVNLNIYDEYSKHVIKHGYKAWKLKKMLII